ncbi:Phosphoenolpyruvate/pyruvate domain-containing protein [Trichoderma velutinum]
MRDYMAASFFQPHGVRDTIRDARPRRIPPNGWYEHLSYNVKTLTAIQPMVHEMVNFSRVPGYDHAAINYAMDAGASPIIPQVDIVEQARNIMSAIIFGMKGRGSQSAPSYRLIPGITDTPLNLQKDMWRNFIIQIESLQRINNLEAIMNMPSGFGVQWCDELEWPAAVESFHSTLKNHNGPCTDFSFAKVEELRTAT